ncbi:MAG: NAD kinase [Saprospiraceae bacterium]|nr:NAD kinase [Saprospiraceae bacterium]
MQVVVYSQVLKKKDIPHVQKLFDALHQHGINAYVFAPYLEQLRGKINFSRDVGSFEGYLDFNVKKFDFAITLGGDGTILAAVTYIRDSGVPIMGINLGRLGFLASNEKSKTEEAVTALVQGKYRISKRTLLTLNCNYPLFDDFPFALNDFTLLKRDTSSMITVHAYVNGAYLNTYWADGIIVSTPTGSTGYSLSCGGPIVFPDSGNFIITPVAPHNLNVRPIVISDDSVITFEIEGRTENFLCTLDSRFETITTQHRLAVAKSDFKIRVVELEKTGFLHTIREKLSWGIDSRNG